jgi:hypothetical protein
VVGVVAVLVAAATLADTLLQRGSAGLFNDFYDYWLAAKVLVSGGNPYDTAALAATAAHVGLHYTVGTGYSYPVLFAYLCLPLSAMPASTAAWVFAALSLAGLGLAVALLAAPLAGLRMRELVLLAVLAGGLTPIAGSLYFGQVNLLVLPLLALAYRAAARPLAVGLATAVKLYPAAALAAVAAQGRRSVRLLVATAAIGAGLTVIPNLLAAKSSNQLGSGLFGPDSFWTNQSINGWVSRLSMTSEFTKPPLPGIPVVPIELGVVLLLGAAVLAVMVWRRGSPWTGCLSLALLYGTVAAPKNSLWNYAPMLLMVFFSWPLVRRRSRLLAVLFLGLALVEVQAVVDYFRHTFYGSPAITWLSSLALYGGLVLVGLNVYLLLTAADQLPDGVVDPDEALVAPKELG